MTETSQIILEADPNSLEELIRDIRSDFDYVPSLRGLVWKNRIPGKMNAVKLGQLAGTVMQIGYIIVGYRNKKYLMHRMVWMHVKGEAPPTYIDHVDGDRLNNLIENLRPCSMSQNLHNAKKSVSNTSGYRGVYWSNEMKKWQAKIGHNYQQFNLGYYPTPEEAHAAYKAKSLELAGEFSNV